MTASSASQFDCDGLNIRWQLRSVNHRFLDLDLHLAEPYRALEPAIRLAIGKRVARGRLSVMLNVKTTNQPALQVNQPLVAEILKLSESLHQPQLAPLSLDTLLKWPGVLQTDSHLNSADDSLILKTLDDALDQLVDMRVAEGKLLAQCLLERLAQCRVCFNHIQADLPALQAALQKNWQAKINAIGTSTVDPDRLAQEVAILLQKYDVDEEVSRSFAHIEQLQSLIQQGGVVGRRADFLLQELLRETNTLAAKSFSEAITDHSIELKVLIEQMREQIQNIE